MPKKILIIKLGAKGDVVRTLPITQAIKEKYPDSEIIWITKKSSEDIVKTNLDINRILTLPLESNQEIENFDILYNFDIESDATELAKKIKASQKLGFSSEDGFATAFNFPSEYYLNTLFDDDLKKSNIKTYQQMMFDAAELLYNKQHHFISLTDDDKKYANNFVAQNNVVGKKLIGIHLGASPRWPSKKWHKDNLKEFIKKASDKNYEILLFGGPDEIQEHDQVFNELIDENIKIHRNNPQNTDLEFISLVNLCNQMICSDSYALHIALSLKKPTIGLFFCTSHQEVEDYDLLKKLVSPLQKDFFPEKMDQYSEELVKSISADEVLKAIEENESC